MEIVRIIFICLSLAVSTSLFFAIPMGIAVGSEIIIKSKKSKRG